MNYLALVMILFLTFLNAEAKSQLLEAKAASALEAHYNKLIADTLPWHLRKEQAFKVQLNSKALKDVVFASFVETGVRFVLFDASNNSIIQTLPKSDLAITGIFSFQKIHSVSFKDVNNDGTLDILILTSYFDSRPVQGEGVGGGSINVGYAFISHGDKFEITEDCSEEVANLKALEKCLLKAVRKK